jgi:hypothetical protein
MPPHWEIRERNKRTIECDHLLEGNNPSIFDARRIYAEKLPPVIVGIVRNVEHGLLTFEDLANRNYSAVALLIEWPIVRLRAHAPNGPN